jgi:hypothetical protein
MPTRPHKIVNLIEDYCNLHRYFHFFFQNLTCFIPGLDMKIVNLASFAPKSCPCKFDYYGSQCSVPGCVYKVPKNGEWCDRHCLIKLLTGPRTSKATCKKALAQQWCTLGHKIVSQTTSNVLFPISSAVSELSGEANFGRT